MSSPDTAQYAFDKAGTYRIRVQGWLDERWSNRLGGMTIETEQEAGREPMATLTGTIIDQAALAGVMDSLFNLGLTLVSVERIEEEAQRQTDKPLSKHSERTHDTMNMEQSHEQ